MNLRPSLKEIRKDLSALNRFEVVIYGSYVDKNFTSRSDVDIAVVTREKDRQENIRIWKDVLKNERPPYQIKVFELLPLHIKADIMDSFIAVFGDKVEISEHFYYYRRLWKDSMHRYYSNQFSGFREKIEKLKISG